MKSTDIARHDRELRREKKRKDIQERRDSKREITVGGYIEQLHALFFHDDKRIFNTTKNNDAIIDLFETMKLELPEKQWEVVIRKAVKKTEVANREGAVKELVELLELLE